MIKIFFVVLKKDVEQVLNVLIIIGLIVLMFNMMFVRRLFDFLLENFIDKFVNFYDFD